MIYDISYKTLIGPKSLGIRFDQIDGFIRIYDGTRSLFGSKNYDVVYNKIRYLKSKRQYISHYFAKIKVAS